MAATALAVGPQVRGLLAALDRFFAAREVRAYVVGGFLRDAILGREVHDVDISLAGDPLALGPGLADALGGSYFPLAEAQQVARVVLPDAALHVDLMPLRAEIEADLLLRDYTIDAMAAPLAEAAAGAAAVIDPAAGRADLGKRLVRVIAEDAFRRDPLRPLRGARLAVELEFAVEPQTAELIRNWAPRLPDVSPERQRDELMRVFATPRAGTGLRLLDDLTLLEQLAPEVTAARGVEQPKEHHWDVFDHCLEAVASLDALMSETEPAGERWRPLWRELWEPLAWWTGAQPDGRPSGRDYFRQEVTPGRSRLAVLKLAGLLHDVAKPQTKTFDDSGRMRFFGHADVGAEVCGSVLRRLRFSAREIALVQTMVKAHLRPVQMAQQGPPTRRALYRYFRDCGDAGVETLFLSLADHLGTVGPNVSEVGWREHVALVNYILAKRFQEEETISPPRLLDGDELMVELDLAPGPNIGRLLETIQEAQAAGEISSRDEALALARAALREKTSAAGSDLA
jgi:poly(A) polymerase